MKSTSKKPAAVNIPITIGDKIKEQRKKLNLTQLELAKEIGVTTAMVSHWEKNKNGISNKHFGKLSHVLGISIQELIEGADNIDFEKEPYSSKEKNLIYSYRQLPIKIAAAIGVLIRSLSNIYQK